MKSAIEVSLAALVISLGMALGQAAAKESDAPSDGAQQQANADAPAIDWLTVFKVHYADRVRSFKEQNAILQNVVFVGDSITEGFDLAAYFPGHLVVNRGIGGDVIGNALPADDQRGVLRRLDSSIYDCAPSQVFLSIGINDLNSGHTPEVMEQGYRDILAKVKKNAPMVKVYVQSLFPTRGNYSERNPSIVDFNRRLKTLANEFGYTYVNLHPLFLDDRGELKAEFTEDGLHLTAPAYEVWRDEVERILGWDGNSRSATVGE